MKMLRCHLTINEIEELTELDFLSNIWKIVAPMVAGHSIDDITANTEMVAIMVPNRAPLVTPRDFPLPGETNRQITNWNSWQDWRVSIDYLEDLTGYNFLSNLPETIQDKIEERDNGLLPS